MSKSLILLSFCLLLVVNSSTIEGEACMTDSDCPTFNNCVNLKCTHKKLFPIEWNEVLASLFITIVNSIATGGGLALGACIVPFLQIMMNYNQSNAISLAYLIILGGGIGNVINIISVKNKNTGGPMINYNIALITIPALVFGSQLGVLTRRVLPSFISSIVLLLILAYGAHGYTKKFLTQYRAEKKAAEEKKKKELEIAAQKIDDNKTPSDGTEYKTLTQVEMLKSERNETLQDDASPEKIKVEVDKKSESKKLEGYNRRREEIIKREQQQYPIHKLKEVILIIVIIFILVIIRGGKGVASVADIEFCSDMDFGMLGIQLAAYLLCLIRNLYLINKWQKEKDYYKIEFTKDDPKLSGRQLLGLSALSIFSGYIGAIAALGGGLIIVPSLFKMGFIPVVAAYSSGFFVIFTSFNSAIQTYFTGTMKGDQIAWFLCLSCFFSFCSARIVQWVFRKTGKQAFMPALIIGIVTVVFIIILILLIIDCSVRWAATIASQPLC